MPHFVRFPTFLAVGLLAALALLLAGSGAPAAQADVGDPDDPITVSASGSEVTASGTWTWLKRKGHDVGRPACEVHEKAVGFAVDWDDGSPLEMMWAGPDPATSVTLLTPQPANNCGPGAVNPGDTGSAGPWGADSHTYTSPGTYNVCVVIYDIHVAWDTGLPETETGKHSINPGPSLEDILDPKATKDYNTDNNIERNARWRDEGDPDTQCVEITLELTITLDPPTATNIVGEDHTVTATVGLEGTPVGEGDADVEFEITAGPNKADTGTDTTDANGEATFTYTGDGGAGTDTIQACVFDEVTEKDVCDTATKTWEEPAPAVQAAVQSPAPTPTPTPTPTPVVLAAALPRTGGEPSDAGSGALPWLAAIAGAIAVMSAGGVLLAYQRRRVR